MIALLLMIIVFFIMGGIWILIDPIAALVFLVAVIAYNGLRKILK